MGEDSRGVRFESIDAFWAKELESPASKDAWYSKSLSYWSQSEASDDGVLSGHGCVSSVDLEGSNKFLSYIRKSVVSKKDPCFFGTVLDCGAGVARVTQGCLLHLFDTCDLLEPVPHLLDKAKSNLRDCKNVEHYFCSSLQDFTPIPGRYDCFWLQWCVLYLTDDDLVACLRRFRSSLKPKGVLCIKENVVLSSSEFQLDREDNALLRTDAHYRRLFKAADLKILFHMRQPKYPPVRDHYQWVSAQSEAHVYYDL